MREQVTNESLGLQFPVLLWEEEYIYLASAPFELCVHVRSVFSASVSKAKAGDLHLLDASGRLFDVTDWVRMRPFGGLKMIAAFLLRSIFARPKLSDERQL